MYSEIQFLRFIGFDSTSLRAPFCWHLGALWSRYRGTWRRYSNPWIRLDEHQNNSRILGLSVILYIELFDPWNGDSLIGTTATNCINNSILYITVCPKDSFSSKCLPIGNVTIRSAMARKSHALQSQPWCHFATKVGQQKNNICEGHYL